MSTPTRIGNAFLTVDVSSLGAEMQALSSSDGRNWLWNGDAAFWSGRSPVLFPIVGKAPADTLMVDGKPYPMNQHGFARRSAFVLSDSTETMCRHELAASAATRDVYPFDFKLVLEHSVSGSVLTVAATVTNLGDAAMPFGIGFHPAFVWPLPGAAGRAHTVTLDNVGEPALARLDGGLLKPDAQPSPFHAGRLQLDHAMFDEDAMIFPQDAGDGLVYAAQDGPALRFRFENLPNLALWTKPGAPFICIEPWHGTAAAVGGSSELAQRPFGKVLQPETSARFAFVVEIPQSQQ